MADDQRVYSDEEFALILRQAAELASQTELTGASADGMTLAEMKTVAAQVGIDPALVARAARMLAAKRSASPLDRLLGGPLRHDETAHFASVLDQRTAARLLSAVRIRAAVAGKTDVGHSNAMGMTWHDGGDTESLGVTAHSADGGTDVSLVFDRRVTFGLGAVMTSVVMFMALLFAGSALYPESSTLGVAGAAVAVGGPLAIARAYWASSTKRVRERMGAVMDAIGQTLAAPVPEVKPTDDASTKLSRREEDPASLPR